MTPLRLLCSLSALVFALALLLAISAPLPAAAQTVTLPSAWLGSPSPSDYAQPAVYWQRVLAVHGGQMTGAQRALVETYIRTRQAPPSVPGVATGRATLPQDEPSAPCTPYAYAPCWDEPVGPSAAFLLPSFRVGQRYTGAYGWRMRVLSIVLDGTDEVITAKWLESAPGNAGEGSVFAFKNSPSQSWVEY